MYFCIYRVTGRKPANNCCADNRNNTLIKKQYQYSLRFSVEYNKARVRLLKMKPKYVEKVLCHGISVNHIFTLCMSRLSFKGCQLSSH